MSTSAIGIENTATGAVSPDTTSTSYDPAAVEAGLPLLRERITADAPGLARAFADYTLVATGVHADRLGDRRRTPVPLETRNIRRRAARMWINALAEGRTDTETLTALTTTWLPTLANGPTVTAAPRFISWLRGALSSSIFADPSENLIPDAYAVYALEAVIDAHERAASPQRSAQRA